ncbi:hypothetical protein GKODMF_09035 [Candidatus Electrothrix gigas]
MSHEILIQLTGIFILGIIAQWTAWKLHLPSILFLLIAGLIVGPGLGLLHPDQLFGEGLDFFRLNHAFGSDPTIKLTKLTKEFDYQAFMSEYNNAAIVLFVLKSNHSIEVCTVDSPVDPVAGDVLISIVPQTQQAVVPTTVTSSQE